MPSLIRRVQIDLNVYMSLRNTYDSYVRSFMGNCPHDTVVGIILKGGGELLDVHNE